jgi:uncharacterized protein (TIGR02466 family)
MASEAPKGRVLRLFTTPVIVDELADAEELNAELEKTIIAQQERDPGVKLSNRGGWQSKRDFPAWAGEAGRRLVQHALSLASAHSAAGQGAVPRWSVDVWANVTGSGSFNMAHVHGGSYWSAVYYVSVGEGQGGQLVLHDPRMPGLRMHAPNLRFKDVGPELRADIQPKAGLMILFPAWLSHSVEPWEGTGNRVSVAMNIRAAPARG